MDDSYPFWPQGATKKNRLLRNRNLKIKISCIHTHKFSNSFGDKTTIHLDRPSLQNVQTFQTLDTCDTRGHDARDLYRSASAALRRAIAHCSRISLSCHQPLSRSLEIGTSERLHFVRTTRRHTSPLSYIISTGFFVASMLFPVLSLSLISPSENRI